MKHANIFVSWGAQLVIERPARKLTIHELIAQLEQSAGQMAERYESSTDTPDNRRLICHMIGIERWGQRRLRVALGEPFLIEEYDHYLPSPERTWEELLTDWHSIRQATITLARELAQANIPADFKINHNHLGSLSIKGWLRYLDVHASSEGKHIK